MLEHHERMLGGTSQRLAAAAAASHLVLLASFIIPEGFLALEGQVITVIPGVLWAWILTAAIAMLRLPATSPGGSVSPRRGRGRGS
jgi:hypothetical protein